MPNRERDSAHASTGGSESAAAPPSEAAAPPSATATEAATRAAPQHDATTDTPGATGGTGAAEAAASDGAGAAAGRATMEVTVTVNGQERRARVEPRMLLVHFLRDELGLTGTHIGCDTTNCGACTILVDGTPLKSCTMFAVQARGAEILTVEGLAALEAPGARDGLHPLQAGFKEEHGLQCGFCTPGMLMVAQALLEENPNPTDAQIRHAISGNLCRCTGYQNIIKSVRYAADRMSEGRADGSAGQEGQEGAQA